MVNTFEATKDLVKDVAANSEFSFWPAVAGAVTLEALSAEWRGSLIRTFDDKIYVVRNTAAGAKADSNLRPFGCVAELFPTELRAATPCGWVQLAHVHWHSQC